MPPRDSEGHNSVAINKLKWKHASVMLRTRLCGLSRLVLRVPHACWPSPQSPHFNSYDYKTAWVGAVVPAEVCTDKMNKDCL